MDRIIYKAASPLSFIVSIFLRGGCIAGLIYLFLHYEENPIVITIVMLICLFLFFFLGNDEVYIYSKRIIVRDTSVISLFQKSKIYYIADINSASLPEPSGQDRPNVVDTGILAVITAVVIASTSRHRNRFKNNLHPFLLNMKNGDIVTVSVTLSDNTTKRIVDEINTLIN
jgi:hypothetical protein